MLIVLYPFGNIEWTQKSSSIETEWVEDTF